MATTVWPITIYSRALPFHFLECIDFIQIMNNSIRQSCLRNAHHPCPPLPPSPPITFQSTKRIPGRFISIHLLPHPSYLPPVDAPVLVPLNQQTICNFLLQTERVESDRYVQVMYAVYCNFHTAS